nr:hypothetical protein [Tanacetum cinerariifolium]
LNDSPTPSSDFMTKSSFTSLNSLLEETNTFDNSLPEFETFCFDLEEISSGSTTTHFDISLPEYEAFYDEHVKKISGGIFLEMRRLMPKDFVFKSSFPQLHIGNHVSKSNQTNVYLMAYFINDLRWT